MKIAVCVSGLLRDHKKSFESLKEHVIRDYDVDLFIHSWEPENDMLDDKWGLNTEGVKDPNMIKKINGKKIPINKGYDMREIKMKKLIKEISNYYPITKINLDKQSKCQEEITRIKDSLGKYPEKWSPYNFSCWLYSLFKCNELKNEYAEKNNIEYDLVIRTRTELDFYLQLDKLNLENIKKVGLAIPAGGDMLGKCRGKTSINDQFAIGTTDAMNHYCSLKNIIPVYRKGGQHWNNPHKLFYLHLQEYCKSKNITLYRWEFPYQLRGILLKGMKAPYSKMEFNSYKEFKNPKKGVSGAKLANKGI